MIYEYTSNPLIINVILMIFYCVKKTTLKIISNVDYEKNKLIVIRNTWTKIDNQTNYIQLIRFLSEITVKFLLHL